MEDRVEAVKVEKEEGWKERWRKSWKWVKGEEKCLVCGIPLTGKRGQVVKYCSKECREVRHNKKRGGE